MSRTIQITFDAADPNGLAAFWNEVLGYTFQPPPDGFDTWDDALDQWGVPPEDRNMASASLDPDERGPRLFFQRVPEGKTAKNRLPSTSAPHRGSRAVTNGWPRWRPSVSGSWLSAVVGYGAPSPRRR
jgi:hypothetical protein